jgi:lipopolysaccharide export system ATP-binding protein
MSRQRAQANGATRLAAEGLVKFYGRRQVVRDVSLHVDTGEVVGLLGPNGAGKTSAFYLITGLLPADGGTITLGSDDITSLPMHARARRGIGYLPQEASVFRKLSVADNIMAILQTRAGMTSAQRHASLEQLLEELHIQQIRNSDGISLSGGERRRVEIARALAADPKFMLLDEPFAGVDPISVNDIRTLVKHLQARNIGVLITDHNVRETLSICSRAYILSNGTVIAEGNPQAILKNDKVREVYLGEDFRL